MSLRVWARYICFCWTEISWCIVHKGNVVHDSAEKGDRNSSSGEDMLKDECRLRENPGDKLMWNIVDLYRVDLE